MCNICKFFDVRKPETQFRKAKYSDPLPNFYCSIASCCGASCFFSASSMITLGIAIQFIVEDAKMDAKSIPMLFGVAIGVGAALCCCMISSSYLMRLCCYKYNYHMSEERLDEIENLLSKVHQSIE